MLGEIPNEKRIQPNEISNKLIPQGDNCLFTFHKGTINKDNSDYIIALSKSMDEKSLGYFNKMISIHGNLYHQTIIPLIAFFAEENSPPGYVLPFMKNGDLETLLESRSDGKTPEGWNDTKRLINIIGIASGMKYLHSKSVLHNNLNPSDILLDDNFYPLIGGFYQSIILTEGENIKDFNSGEIAPLYMAPEMFLADELNIKSDVFSFSTILYQLVTGKPVVFGQAKKTDRPVKILHMITQGFRPHTRELDVPKIFSRLIHKCWNQDPTLRPTFEEIYSVIIENLSSIIQEYPEIDEKEVREYIKKID